MRNGPRRERGTPGVVTGAFHDAHRQHQAARSARWRRAGRSTVAWRSYSMRALRRQAAHAAQAPPPAYTSYALSTLPRVTPSGAGPAPRAPGRGRRGPTWTVSRYQANGLERPARRCGPSRRARAPRAHDESSKSGCAQAGSSPSRHFQVPARRTGVGRGPAATPASPMRAARGRARRGRHRRGDGRGRARPPCLRRSACDLGQVVHQPRRRQAVQEAPAVAALDQAAVEHGQDAAVARPSG